MSSDQFDPKGVIPACLMPFGSDLEIDEAAYRRHLSDLASVEGITAITVNGHAAEVHALSFEEQLHNSTLPWQRKRCRVHFGQIYRSFAFPT